jgi:effector-binding domain-containing protein
MSEIQMTQLQTQYFVGIRRKVDVKELEGFFAEALPKVMGWVMGQGVQPASMPAAIWWAMDMENGIADCQAGCFVSESLEGDGEITLGETASGDVLTITNVGPYSTVGQSWMAIYKHAAELGRQPGAGWEIYVDDPGKVAEAELRTEIFLPVQ